MHASTEQLLAIRDGGLVDAGSAQHVADCADCRDRLTQLREMAAALRELPQRSPPDDGWSRLAARLDEPAPTRHRWLGGAVAAAALIAAVGLWQWDGNDDARAPTDRIAMTAPEVSGISGETGGNVVPVEPLPVARIADTADLGQLVSQSRRLEQLLRELNSNNPRVMNAGTAGTIAGLQDGIAYIDYGLSYADQLDRSQSEQLWRQRVGLMNTLVQVRGAQLQQISD